MAELGNALLIIIGMIAIISVMFYVTKVWQEVDALKAINQPTALKVIMSNATNEKMIHNPNDLYRPSDLQVRRLEAIKRYQAGEKPQFSIAVCGLMAYGYGERDRYDYWQWPLAYNDLNDEDRALVDSLNGDRYPLMWEAGSKITDKD